MYFMVSTFYNPEYSGKNLISVYSGNFINWGNMLKNKESCRLNASFLYYLRRVRDSNPRYSFPYTHFPGVLLQPLGQVSNIFYYPRFFSRIHTFSRFIVPILSGFNHSDKSPIFFITQDSFPAYTLSPDSSGLLQPLGQVSNIFY